MSFLKKISDFGVGALKEQNHKWFVVSSYLFKGINQGDRLKIELNNKKYFGYYKFYLFSIAEIMMTVNGSDCHIPLDEDIVDKCYDIILNASVYKSFPIKIKKLSNNPNDFDNRGSIIEMELDKFNNNDKYYKQYLNDIEEIKKYIEKLRK